MQTPGVDSRRKDTKKNRTVQEKIQNGMFFYTLECKKIQVWVLKTEN